MFMAVPLHFLRSIQFPLAKIGDLKGFYKDHQLNLFKYFILILISAILSSCNAVSNYCVDWGKKGEFQDFSIYPFYLNLFIFFFLPMVSGKHAILGFQAYELNCFYHLRSWKYTFSLLGSSSSFTITSLTVFFFGGGIVCLPSIPLQATAFISSDCGQLPLTHFLFFQSIQHSQQQLS